MTANSLSSHWILPVSAPRAARALERKLIDQGGPASEWADLGELLLNAGQFSDAERAYSKAIAKAPGNCAYVRGRAAALTRLRQYDDAITLRRGLPPVTMDVAANSDDLRNLRRFDDAIAEVDLAEAEGRSSPAARVIRGFAKLFTGDYRGGFADFEDRFAAGLAKLPKQVPAKRWDGSLTPGLRLLIVPDQGLGDDLNMLRFGRALAGAGIKASFAARKPLFRLLRSSDTGLEIIESIGQASRFDAWCPVSSLPHALRFKGPPPAPVHLTPPREATERGQGIIQPYDARLRVGVCWTGNLKFLRNEIRCVPPERFRPLAELPGVRLFSLYKGPAIGQLAESGMSDLIIDAASDDADLADAAGLIEALDLVISTDTSIVHLAASMGKPVWNLLPFESFWHYGYEGERTDWYPSMRLFRQPVAGDWETVLSDVVRALKGLLQSSSGGT